MEERAGEGVTEGGVRVFIGHDRYQAFLDAAKLLGVGVSPGGADAELHCTRQYIHKLLAKGKLRAVIYKERASKPASYCMIALDDVRAYGERVGRGEPADFQAEQYDKL